MKQLSVLIKPASSLCNMKCKYCFYLDEAKCRSQDSYGILPLAMAEDLVIKSFARLDDNGTLAIMFQGGEPLLAGIEWFRDFLALVDKYRGQKQKVTYGLQTNATLVNDDWAKLFKERGFLIGISLDGYQSNMDKYRYDKKQKSVYHLVMNGIGILRKHQIDFNILTVVTKTLAKNPEGLFKYYIDNGIEYVQLIPCLPSLNGDGAMDAEALTPELFASFYISFFDKWYESLRKGKYLDVNLFSNLLEIASNRMPYQCGMLGHCSPQYVIEGDGSVFPCDFYAVDQYLMGNIKCNDYQELDCSKGRESFISDGKAKRKICNSCRFVGICNGGCRRQNVCYLRDDYCGYQLFLQHAFDKIIYLASKGY